jgi:hypothetical protein
VATRPPVPLALDVKHTTPEELEHGLEMTPGFLSSNEQTFTSSGVEAVLQARFPEPCRYEK